MKILLNIISFILWLVTVPLSIFPLFRMKTSIEFDILITTIERSSDWVEISYMKSISDLWQSENQLLAVCLVILIMVLPGIKYLLDFLRHFKNVHFNKLDGIKRLVFVDIFLVSLLLLVAYNVEVLIIQIENGLYMLIGSVLCSYLSLMPFNLKDHDL